MSLIDQGRFDDAVLLLTDQMNQNPENPKTRVLLASALAAKSGIVLTDFAGFIRFMLSRADMKKNKDEGLSEKMAAQVELIFDSLKTVPDLIQGLDDILYAIEILNIPNLTSGGFLYRALLKLVVFKNRFNGEYRMQPTSNCMIKPRALDFWLMSVEMEIQSILTDTQLSLGQPKKKEKIQRLQTKLAEVNKDVRESLEPELGKPLIKMPFILKKNYVECR